MRRCRPFPELVLLGAAVMCSSACAPRTPHSEAGIPGVIGAPPGVVESTQQVDTVVIDPVAASRFRGLEQQLAIQDHQIAAVHHDLEEARQLEAETAGGGAPTPAQAAPAADRREATSERATSPGSSAPPGSGAAIGAPASPPPTGQNNPGAQNDPNATGRSAAGATSPAGAAVPAPDPRLIEAQRRIGRLERQLAMETKRRQEVEAEMNRLLQETSAGPYEQSESVVEKHLRQQLDRARREIAGLRNMLATEQRSRDDVERRFAALQAQAQSGAPAGDAPAKSASSEEIAALKERQRRVLASIQQDLEASKQREAEMRQTFESTNGNNGVALADTVVGLRTENSALQTRLDDEHQRNAELTAKLQLAQRVTDLIFRMQKNGTQAGAATALPAPR